MFNKTSIMYIYAQTPIHPGSGATLGVVDLPIQRERHTEFPMIQGSSLKGVLRSYAEDFGIEKSMVEAIFGEQDQVGGISITDARILAFPVRALKGVFCWVTCPLVLDRYKRDLKLVGIQTSWQIPKTLTERAKVCDNTELIVDNWIYIEDLQLPCEKDENINKIAHQIANSLPQESVYDGIKEKLQRDLVIVSDDVFRDLVLLTTEVVTRIKINPEKGTVEQGGLWSEEYLPTDTIMYSLILVPDRLRKLNSNNVMRELRKYDEKIIQIGGDETIGKGFALIKLVEGKNAAEC